jgi:hypothetical protein
MTTSNETKQHAPRAYPATGHELGPLVVRAGGHGNPRVVTPAGLVVVERLAREGLADMSIAAALRMDRETFRQLRGRQPDVEEALARGRSGLEDELTDLLLQRARDPKHPGCVVAAIYLTKARCGWREGDMAPGSQVVHAENVQINMPAALTDEQFRALLARGGAPVPLAPPPPSPPEPGPSLPLQHPVDEHEAALIRELMS